MLDETIKGLIDNELLDSKDITQLLDESIITEEQALKYYVYIIKNHYDFDSYEVLVNTPFINVIKDSEVKTIVVGCNSYVNNETYSTMVDLIYLQKISNKEVIINNNLVDEKVTVLFDDGMLKVEFYYNNNIINVNGIEAKMLNRFGQMLNTELSNNNLNLSPSLSLMIPFRFFNEFVGFDVEWIINKAVVTNNK